MASFSSGASNFEKWLGRRDIRLVETMSREKMMEDDLDALKSAKRQAQEEDELETKIRIIKYLAELKKKVESFVDANQKGSSALKLLAAALLNHEKSKAGISSHVRKVYNHDLKNLKDLQKIFSHENLVKVMHDVDALHALHLVMDTDFRDHMGNLEKDPAFTAQDHTHGDLGKKFAGFVVSHIKHAADDVLGTMLADHQKDEENPHAPEEDDGAPSEPMGDDMPADMGEEVPADMGDAGEADAEVAPAPDQSPDAGADLGLEKLGAAAAGGPAPAAGMGSAVASPDMGGEEGPESGADASDDNALMPPVGMAAPAPQAGAPAQGKPPAGQNMQQPQQQMMM